MTTLLASHDKISPTAKMVAYWRQYANIPFSKDIAQQFQLESAMRTTFGDDMVDEQKNKFFVSFLEMRYECIRNFILRSGIKQILEFASGISLRGLAMTSNPAFTYVETDLPDLTEEKTKLVQSIMNDNNIQQRNNLFFHSANILNYNEIELTLEHFDSKKPVVIANEGLFQYLTKDEKKTAAKNIHKILTKFGGVWITPDLETKFSLANTFPNKDEYKKLMDVITLKTKRNFDANAFENETEIFSFFEDIGFDVKYQSQWQADVRLSSLDGGSTSAEMTEALKSLRLWILAPK